MVVSPPHQPDNSKKRGAPAVMARLVGRPARPTDPAARCALSRQTPPPAARSADRPRCPLRAQPTDPAAPPLARPPACPAPPPCAPPAAPTFTAFWGYKAVETGT